MVKAITTPLEEYANTEIKWSVFFVDTKHGIDTQNIQPIQDLNMIRTDYMLHSVPN